MSEYPFTIEPLGKQDRDNFCCGSEPLDRYFKIQVSQDIRRRLTACYIAICTDTQQIAGYYTLSATHISMTDLPDDVSKKLPRYPSIPAVRIGRLAVAKKFQGQGLGSTLLANAAFRILRSDIAAFAITIDAKDDQAMTFYRHHGFLDLNAKERTMFVALSKFSKAFGLFDA